MARPTAHRAVAIDYVEPARANGEFARMSSDESKGAQSAGEGSIDVVAHDPKTDEVVLVMRENEPWTGEVEQLFRLQERFNTYVSFLLDGDLAESHSDLAQKRARIELRSRHMPDPRTIDLLGQIRDQLVHQEIDLQVVVQSTK